MQNSLGGAAVEGVRSRHVQPVLDDVQVPVGQVRHCKPLQRLQDSTSPCTHSELRLPAITDFSSVPELQVWALTFQHLSTSADWKPSREPP